MSTDKEVIELKISRVGDDLVVYYRVGIRGTTGVFNYRAILDELMYPGFPFPLDFDDRGQLAEALTRPLAADLFISRLLMHMDGVLTEVKNALLPKDGNESLNYQK